MIPTTPSLQPAIQAINRFAADAVSELSSEDGETILEVSARLQHLSELASQLIEINNQLWENEGQKISFDPSKDTITISIGGQETNIRLNRADPDVPMTMNPLFEGAAYHAGRSEPPIDPESSALERQLGKKLESFYTNAHRVLKLLGTIGSLPKVKCKAVSRVRNCLIEHPDQGTMYTFGYGSTGPRVKPMHQGPSKWNDEGLVPNTLDFVAAIEAACIST